MDEVRVSNPACMAASVAPLGTEKGKRYQLTVALNTEKLDAAFSGFAILHSNDKSRPNVKVEVTASPDVRDRETILLFHADRGPDVERVREAIAKLPTGMRCDLLDAGDVANLDRLRVLERSHGVTQGGGYELFYGEEAFVSLDAREVVEALGRIAAGQPVSSRQVWVHDHGEAPAQDAAAWGSLLPPPIAVDLLVDANCERCAQELREGVKELEAYAGKLVVTPRNLSHPDVQRLVSERIPPEHRPPHVHCIALTDGGAYAVGDVGQVLDSLPSLVREPSVEPGTEIAPQVKGAATSEGDAVMEDMLPIATGILVALTLLNTLLLLRSFRRTATAASTEAKA